jgi:hypothetical protein
MTMRVPSILKSLAFAAALTSGTAVSAQATIYQFGVNLSGPAEAPPNASPGTGFATIIFDDAAHTLSLDVTFSGLLAGTTASHIHCCTAVPGVSTAGVATQTPSFVGFPLGVTSGTYSHIFDTTDMATYNAPFLAASGGTAAGAEAALIVGAIAGKAYLNIHSTMFGGGEIRGFLEQTPVPGALPLFATGLGMLGLYGWRRKRRPQAA